MKPSLIKAELKDQRQLLQRFWLATLLVSTVLGGFLWKKRDLVDSQIQISDVVALSTQVGRGVIRTALFLEVGNGDLSPTERQEHLDLIQDQLATLSASLVRIEAMRNETGYKRRFAVVFFDPELGLERKFDRFIRESQELTEAFRAGKTLDPATLRHLVRTSLPEILSTVDTVRRQSVILSQARLDELQQLQLIAYAFILLLFVGMAVYIIFPTKRLLQTQHTAHEEAVVSLRERNAEIALSRENLAVQKRILQSVLDSIGEAVVVFQSSGTVLLQNPAALRLFPASAEGMHFDAWTKLVGLIDTETTLPLTLDETPISAATQGGLSGRLMEVKNAARGEPVYLTVTGMGMLDEAGSHQGAVLSFHDVSDRVRSEMELRQANASAEAASRSKSEFLANISHEIRTPMTAILGYADLLLAGSFNEEQRRSNLQVIRRNGQILVKLIDDILDISKIEAGKLDIHKRQTSLQSLVSEIHSLLGWRAKAKNVVFGVKFVGALPSTIVTAPERLRQILFNVLGNALKFTEVGEVELTVRLLAAGNETPPLLEFVVRDTGCGIPEGAAQKLFSPFVQVDATTTRRFGGSGLGLALSRRLARALGGDLWLERSSPGEGSTFIATIDPGYQPDMPLVENMTLNDTLGGTGEEILPTKGLEGLKILVIEDSPENRDLFAWYLETAGASVTTANDGQQGVERAMASAFDLLLMDVQMPRMDGYRAVSVLKQANYAAPILALTAHAMDEEKTRCLKAGFHDVITKPIDPAGLVASVKAAVLGASAELPPKEDPENRVLVESTRLANASPRVRAILERFVEGIPVAVGEIREAGAARDWDKMLHLTHRFKGTAGNCGFSALRRHVDRLEDAAQKPFLRDAVPGLIEDLQFLAGASVEQFKRIQPHGEVR